MQMMSGRMNNTHTGTRTWGRTASTSTSTSTQGTRTARTRGMKGHMYEGDRHIHIHAQGRGTRCWAKGTEGGDGNEYYQADSAWLEENQLGTTGRVESESADQQVGYGPDVPPESPDWVKDLYRQAEEFPEETYLKDLLMDTGGDPMKIEMNARRKLAESNIGQSQPAEKAEMKVTLDEVNSFSLWIWFEFYEPPNEAEQELLESVLESWFILGKLGSFNSLNMQISNSYDASPSFFQYNAGELESSIPAMFHEMQEIEFDGNLGRVWVNMGTCDEMALDVLINGLSNFNLEYCSIRELVIGGQQYRGWVAPKMQSAFGDSPLPTETMFSDMNGHQPE